MDKETRKNNGAETAKIGAAIKQTIESEYPNLRVYFDHGPAGSKRVTPKLESTEHNPRSRYQSLAWIDIGIINPKTKKALLLIEIEEGQATPKVVIGDICNIFFADRVQVGEDDYNISDVRMLLALTNNEKHNERHQAIVDSIDHVIAPAHRRNIKAEIVNIGDPNELGKYLLQEARRTCDQDALSALFG